MGNAFGSSKTVQGDVKVWGEQAPYLKKNFSEASSIYDAAKGSGYYGGPTYANLDPATLARIKAAASSNQIAGQAGADSLGGAGNDFLDASHGDTLKSLMASLNDPNGAMNRGNEFANSDAATGMVNAGMTDIRRGLQENDLPQAQLGAIATGNGDSSRLGARQAILTRGAEDRAGDMSNQIRGSFFNSGVGQYNNDIAAKAGMISNLNSMGAGDLAGANSLGQSGLAGLTQAAGIDQQDQQGGFDAALKQWMGNDTRASELLQRMFGVTGQQVGQAPGITSSNSPGWFNQVFKPI